MSQAASPRSDIHPVFQLANAVPDRLVHLIPDELAVKVPEHPLFAWPKTDTPRDGLREVSSKCFANAINRTAWYLEGLLGKNPKNFPSIAYMGAADIRYFLLMFGAIKAGYKMLFLSPRNSVAGHLNVLEKADCHTFLKSKTIQNENILSQREMKTAIVPELEELLDDAEVAMYPYTKNFEQARKDPCLVLHTTGSTGLPKPITWKLEILSTYEAWRTIPELGGYVSTTEIYQESRRAYNSMPLFHTSGLNTGITMTLLLGTTTIYGSANVVPHAAYADEMHKYADVDSSVGPPSMYEELSHDPVSLERISKMRFILVCGAPISQTAGDILCKETRLICNFGATETAALPRLAPSREDWAYYYWHPTHSGIELRPSVDNLYELFLVKDPKIDLYQGIFSTFPHLQEYSMNDLYSKHPDPSKGFLYRWRGRADDVIVLSNGEKLTPPLMEASLMSSPLVKGSMVIGRGKFQPAALVDLGQAPPDDAAGKRAVIKELAPFIAEANRHAPAHGKLDKDHILFVDPARPIYYLGQGKIQRNQTYKKYEQDFEDLYAAAENIEEQEGDDKTSVDFGNRASIRNWLKSLITEVAEINELKGDDAFFEAGMDSLHVIRLVRELKYQAKLHGNNQLTPDLLSPGVVYSHPSLDELSDFIYKQAGVNQQGVDSAYQSSDEGEGNPKLQSILDKFVQSLPAKTSPRPAPVTQGTTVLLTGSTGSLGSYLLNELMKDSNVDKVIALDRTANAAEKHKQSGPQRGLAPVDLKRVEFLKSDLSDAHLGLGKEVYSRVQSEVTHVILNFNWVVGSFKPYIAGVRNLAAFAATSAHNAFVLFISSIAAVDAYKGPGQVPEAPVLDLNAAAPTGYGQSKLLSEVLLDKAAEKSGLRSAVCRVGIVAGPVERQLGLWNTHEYVPSIVVSSAHLGVFPKDFPSRDHIDWLPVDKLSKIIVEILGSASEPAANQGSADSGHAKTYHVVNPQASSWSADLSAEMVAAYPEGTVKGVSFEEWLAKLTASAEAADVDAERNPAIRLLEFYTKALANAGKTRRVLPTVASQQASKTLRELGPLNRTWMENWMVQWGIKTN
ncbi:MAG: putative NRPS-like protein biosynthetic cluster [Bathelium mastoideum]|nr:MAG: putative NRPS-like protein biosynthetic cluster [Bathelium mastoideum]